MDKSVVQDSTSAAGDGSRSPIWVLRLKHWLLWLFGPYPFFIRFLAWRHGTGNGIVGPTTQIVIESYPRSGNTFSVTAFELAQGRRLRQADHLHAPAQVVLAARWSIPCLVLIRGPEDAVFSYVMRFPHISVRQCVADYVRFYETVLPCREHFVLARFESVTRDFGAVIRALNEKFGTAFAEFDHTPENEERCFALVQQRYESRYGGGQPISESIHSRPSPEKSRLKEANKVAFLRQYHAPALAGLRGRAERLYRDLSGGADL